MLQSNNKRGQMRLSFGMLFSIILIIIFLAFAFFAVKKFLSIGNTAQLAKFRDSFQADIDRVWKGSQGSDRVEYILPQRIIYLCFVDYEQGEEGEHRTYYRELNQVYFGSENLFFYPVGSAEGLDSTEIKHIKLEDIVDGANPFCIENIDGKVRMTLKKEYGEALVTIAQ